MSSEIHHNVTGTVSLSAHGPTTLFLNPSAISVLSNTTITKLEYDWDDGTTAVVNRKLNTASIAASSVPIPSDKGDPRNTIVSRTFYPAQYDNTNDFGVKVYATYSNNLTAALVGTINLAVIKVSLLDSGFNSGYAQGVHLIANRVWGSTNKKLFMMETIQPEGVFSAVVADTFITITEPIVTPPPTTPPPTSPDIAPYIIIDNFFWADTTQYGNSIVEAELDIANNRVRFVYIDGSSSKKDDTDTIDATLRYKRDIDVSYSSLEFDEVSGWYTLPTNMQFAQTNTLSPRLSGTHGTIGITFDEDSTCENLFALSSIAGGYALGNIDVDFSDLDNITVSVVGVGKGNYSDDRIELINREPFYGAIIEDRTAQVLGTSPTSFIQTFELSGSNDVRIDFGIATTIGSTLTAFTFDKMAVVSMYNMLPCGNVFVEPTIPPSPVPTTPGPTTPGPTTPAPTTPGPTTPGPTTPAPTTPGPTTPAPTTPPPTTTTGFPASFPIQARYTPSSYSVNPGVQVQWIDTSGNGYLANKTGGNLPTAVHGLNGLSAAQPPGLGIDGRLLVNGGSPHPLTGLSSAAIMCVFKTPAVAQNLMSLFGASHFNGGTTNMLNLEYTNSTFPQYMQTRFQTLNTLDPAPLTPLSSVNANTWYCYYSDYDGLSARASIDGNFGLPKSMTGAISTGQDFYLLGTDYIGGNFYMDGQMHELVLFNRNLTIPEREEMFRYVLSTYTLSSSLITETDWNLSDWDVTSYSINSGVGTTSATAVPDADTGSIVRQVSHLFDTSGSLVFNHVFTGKSYNPSVQGPIDKMRMRFDRRIFVDLTTIGGSAMGCSFIARQGGEYFAPQDDLTFSNTSWATYDKTYPITGWTKISQVDASAIAGSPDFTTGGTIEFGILLSNSSTPGVRVTSRFDNFEVAIGKASL